MANAAANLAGKMMGDATNDLANTPEVSNPDKNPAWADPSGEKMKALAWYGKNDVRLVETFKPAIVDPDDVIIKVTGSTICGSDLHLYHGSIIQMQKGDILGHEFCGVIDKIGPKVKTLKPGDRVVASFQIACGECRFCKQKISSMCERTNNSSVENAMYGNRTAGMLGYSHFTGGYAGGQAEYVRLPHGDVNLLKIPDNLSDEQCLYLSDVLPTSYNCVVDTGVNEGDVVAIWGMGPIGLFAAQWAFIKGASRVIGIDQNWRLDYAKSKLPKIETINFKNVKSVKAEIDKLVPGGLDVALECAAGIIPTCQGLIAGEFVKGYLHAFEVAVGLENDTSEILNEMITCVRPYGRIGITGVYAGFTNHFNIGAIMETGIRLIGNGQAPVQKYWHEILNDYIIPGKIDPLMMVTHRIDLSEMPELYKRFDAREESDGLMKVFVQTKFSNPPGKGAPALSTLA